MVPENVMLLLGSGEWHKFSQKLPVPDGDPTRSVCADDILVMLFHLNDLTGFVPFEGVRSSLVLDVYVVTQRVAGDVLCALPIFLLTACVVCVGLSHELQEFQSIHCVVCIDLVIWE